MAYEYSGEKMCYALTIQNYGFIFLSGADGCQQPCGEARENVSIGRAPRSKASYDECMRTAYDCAWLQRFFERTWTEI